uniref:Transmembrane protein 54a n=1 Tax=Amphilophus citrinellus TaxID=61819 RepID=A0A3Q0TDG8_AMPCI
LGTCGCFSFLRQTLLLLMKMGLGLVLVGHINFLLGALVHGTVLRHSVFPQSSNKVYTISNIIAILAGLLGVIGGITAIVLSRNKKNRILMWVLLVFSFLAGLLALASTMAVLSSVIKAIMSEGHSLLTHCTDIHKITDECPFDPTRIYGTTIILWVPLIFMSIVETVFSFHCFAACTSFIRLCPCRKKPVKAAEPVSRQRISSTLENHGTGLVHLHHLSHDLHKQHQLSRMLLYKNAKYQSATVTRGFLFSFTHRFEYGFIGLIINPIPQWVIHSVIFTLSSPNVLQRTRQTSTRCLTTLTF